MEVYSFYSYLSATVGYALLLILALKRTNKIPVNFFFTFAISASLVCSGYTAYVLMVPTAFIANTFPFETLNCTAWFLFLYILIFHQQFKDKYSLLIKSRRFNVLLVLILMVLVLETSSDILYLTQQIIGYDLRIIAHTGFAIVGLVLVEQLYRNGMVRQHWAVKFLCLGLGAIFIVDFALYSKSFLYQKLDYTIWGARGFIHVLVMPLLAISIKRLQDDLENTEFSISRPIIFHTTALFCTGTYLILMSLAGFYIRDYGGSWGEIAQTVFFLFAILLLLVFMVSGKVRAQSKVYLNKHFFQDSYDYRNEWIKLNHTLSELNDLNQLSSFIIRTMADFVDSTGGTLWLKNEQGDYYLAEQVNLVFQPMQLIKSTDPFIQFLINKQFIIDFVEFSHDPQAYFDVDLSQWLTDEQNVWLIIPLFRQQDMLAFVVLWEARVPRQLNWEDRDLLKTVALQLSNALALKNTSNELSRSRQFEAYNQISAYLVHDLKNLVAQIVLIVKNAETHKYNPEFIDDSLDTLDNVSRKLQHLVVQLKKGNNTMLEQSTIDLVKVIVDVAVQQAGNTPHLETEVEVKECLVGGEKDKMAAILGHLVQNAQEATDSDGWVRVELKRDQQQAIIKVMDNGCGMDNKFIAERLFKPFDTTKGNAGMGIGVYEAREYILRQSGQINVESTPGEGTQFTISFPLI